MAMKSTKNQFGTIAIIIHWLTVLIIGALVISGSLSDDTVDPAGKADILRIHAPLGLSILALTILRVLWWLMADKKPEPVEGMSEKQDKIAHAVHGILYLLLLAMAASGIGLMITSGAREILFNGATGPLPDFNDFWLRIPHGIGAKLVVAMVLFHVGAALYHQFVMKDNLLRRMWW